MVNTIFLGIAVVASAIFLIQFIMSIFFGDLDTDTDIDVDLSSAVSFKGLTHFCIGFGWYMYIAESTAISTFLIGVLIGLLFVFILWFLYKKAYQLQKENKPEKTEALVGRECTIYAHDGVRYIVQVAQNGALREVEVRSLEGKKYQTGDRTLICKVESGTIYIQ